MPVSRLLVDLEERKKKWFSMKVPLYFIDIESKIMNQSTRNLYSSFHQGLILLTFAFNR